MTYRPLLLLLILPLIVPTVAALPLPTAPPSLPAVPGDPTPNASEAIEAQYHVRLDDDLSGFQVDIGLAVYEVDLGLERSLPAQAIRSSPNRDVFEETVERRIQAELERTFPDADVTVAGVAYDYGGPQLDEDPYRPPVRVFAQAQVAFTAAYLGLPALDGIDVATAASAFLTSGGMYVLEETLTVSPGTSVTVIVQVPDHLRLQGPTGPETDRLEVGLDNMANGTARTLPIRFSVRLDPDQVPADVLRGPLVRIGFFVEDQTSLLRQSVPFAPGQFAGRLDLEIQVTSLEGRYFDDYPLPEGLTMDHMSADVLRVAFAARVVHPADVEAFFERLVTRGIQNAFGNETVVEFDDHAFAESAAAPIGGADGRTVAPLVVRATSAVPVAVKDNLVASSMARGIGMIVPTQDSFELTNDGLWDLEYTIVYPDTLAVTGSDPNGRVENLRVDGRHAVRIDLPRGTTADVTLTGRAHFDAAVFAIQAAEFALVGIGAVFGARRVRRHVKARRTPVTATG